MSDIDFSANNCFVCGPDNPIGLKIKFTIDDDDICRGRFTSMENHVGYQNTTHGGIIFSLLDDIGELGFFEEPSCTNCSL